jgi:hypothetical protein
MSTLLCCGCNHLTNTTFVPLRARSYDIPEQHPELDGQATFCTARFIEHADGTATIERGCAYDRAPTFMRHYADMLITEQPWSADAMRARTLSPA